MELPGGLFITFEGPDKAGKSTQIARLAEYLRQRGLEVVLTREPGGTSFCESIRQLVMTPRGDEKIEPLAELLLFSASRIQHIRQLIKPSLAQGKVVLCDRFTDSTIAYQGGARGLERETIDSLNELAVDGCWPQLTFLFDLPVEESLRRLGKMTEETNDRFEREANSFRHAVRDGFLRLADQYPERIKKLDATQSIDQLAAQIQSYTANVLTKISR